jgi:peptidoglycan hydrolase-like protein with peptidoglycan-binding domain
LNRTVLSLLATFTLASSAVAIVPAAEADAAVKAKRLGARVLQQGSQGADVRRLQRLLRATGFALSVDGEFGSGTGRVVQSFQSVTGLPVTGVVDKATVRTLLAATQRAGVAAAADNGGFSLASTKVKRKSLGDRLPVRRGMSGPDVKMLQRFLRRAGVRRVTVDGQFGPGTARAVRTWETRVSRRADGQMDGGDVATLREQVGKVRGVPVETTLISAPADGTGADDPTADGQSGDQATPAPKGRAKVRADGTAVAPADAPAEVKAIIAAGNQIATKPYIYGGGHRADWKMDAGYDCSGSVSWALHGADLVKMPAPSSGYYNWGKAGRGEWVTIYTKDSHMYMVVAGLRFDTSGRSTNGTRWQADMRSSAGFVARHPAGL